MRSLQAALLILTLVACQAPTPQPTLTPQPTPTPVVVSQKVDVGGYKLFIECHGTGSPIVILDAGLGVYSGTWYKVVPQVAAFTRVCRYDRAGMGESSLGPKPRTSQKMIEELHTLLTNANIAPPYLLVGHSLAGLNIRLYASTYPQEVRGLVFVDAIHPDFDALLEPLLSPQAALERRAELELNNEGIRFTDIITSEAQVKAADPLPDMPVVVIRHGLPFAPESATWPSVAVEQLWADLQTELSQLTSNGTVIIATHSQHRIQETEPQVVSEAIKQIWDGVQTR